MGIDEMVWNGMGWDGIVWYVMAWNATESVMGFGRVNEIVGVLV